jgi:hypothetical protein
MEVIPLRLSSLIARRFENDPSQETLYGCWYHTPHGQKTFDDWLDDRWDEANHHYDLAYLAENECTASQ